MDLERNTQNLINDFITNAEKKFNENASSLKLSLREYLKESCKQLLEKYNDQIIQKNYAKGKNQTDSISNKLININVGGVTYTTYIETLTKYKRSKLAKIFTNPIYLENVKEGKIFIDRNGKYFSYILDSLREGELVLPENESDKKLVLKELKYYDLNDYFLSNDCNFKFDENFKHESITLSTNKLTAGKVGNPTNSAVVGNFIMTEGIYQWEFYVDSGNQSIGLGVADQKDLKDLTLVFPFSYMITSEGKANKMSGVLQNIGSSITLTCILNFEKDEFTIIGSNSISVKNTESIVGKKLRIIVGLYTSTNVVSVRNFVKIQ